jgi:hypothetical protein
MNKKEYSIACELVETTAENIGAYSLDVLDLLYLNECGKFLMVMSQLVVENDLQNNTIYF